MSTADWIYFGIVTFLCLAWLVGTVLYIDSCFRTRKWRKRREARRGYLKLVDLSATRRTE